MSCFKPILGYRGPGGRVVASRSRSLMCVPAKAPCGRCDGCRNDRVRDWSVRITHEAKMWDDSCFVTVTLSDGSLPADYSVHLEVVQKFIKRLRKLLNPSPKKGQPRPPLRKIKIFAAAEYGSNDGVNGPDQGRPHYHIIIFGWSPEDGVYWGQSPCGQFRRYKSATLEKLWSDPRTGEPFGLSEFGSVGVESAKYVAGYVNKKCGGEAALVHYQREHPVTGELVRVNREFATMSKNGGGLGFGWFAKYWRDVFPGDFVVVGGKKLPPPSAYFDRLCEMADPESKHYLPEAVPVLEKVLRRRVRGKFIPSFVENSTPERLETRETCFRLKRAFYKRASEL